MSGIDFSTDKADYRLLYTVHRRPVQDPILTNGTYDAFVIEAYHTEEFFDVLWKSPLKRDYEGIFSETQKNKKPIYIVDVLTEIPAIFFERLSNATLVVLGLFQAYTGIEQLRRIMRDEIRMSRRRFLKSIGVESARTIGGAYLAFDFISGGFPTFFSDYPEGLARANSLRRHLLPTPVIELRNAISARKIEEFVAPGLQRRINRKPKIVLVYGAGHSGLKEDLEHRGLRDFYINLYQRIGYAGIDTTYLDVVTTLSLIPDGGYKLEHRNANLF